jgi:hypothetical protein
MTEEPNNYQPNPTSDRDSLKADCHRLIEAISRRPGYLKLLAGVKDYLAIAASYKANRQYERKER